MAKTLPLQSQFTRMVRDVPRNALPKGACWTLEDCIPNLGAPARTRGGWIHYSNDMNDTTGSSSAIIAGLYADQLTPPTTLIIDPHGFLCTVDNSLPSGNTVTIIGTGNAPRQNPVQLGGVAVIPSGNGTESPRRFTAPTPSGNNPLGGSPPSGRYATVWKALLLLASSAAQPQRVWFSTVDLDPESWDTVNSYWDMSFPVVGLAAIRNAVLIFGENNVSRLRGSTPPPGGDLVADDPLFNIGCINAKSIAVWGEQVVWANKDGLYITDGIVPNDLTQLAGMKSFWRDLMSTWDAATHTIAGGVLQNHYVISVMNDTTPVHSAMIDLQKYNWVQLNNVDAASMWHTTSVTGSEKLFFGRRHEAFVGEFSPMFAPASVYKNDANGLPVQMQVETPFFELGAGNDSFRDLYVTYDLRASADADDPSFALSYVKTPEQTAYTSISSVLAETTVRARRKRPLGFKGQGLGVKVTQNGASSDGRLWALEVDGHAREPSGVS